MSDEATEELQLGMDKSIGKKKYSQQKGHKIRKLVAVVNLFNCMISSSINIDFLKDAVDLLARNHMLSYFDILYNIYLLTPKYFK